MKIFKSIKEGDSQRSKAVQDMVSHVNGLQNTEKMNEGTVENSWTGNVYLYSAAFTK